MNIMFLTTLNPYDINIWSGTMFHVLQTLKKRHHVRVVGINLLSQSFYFVRNSFHKRKMTKDRMKHLKGAVACQRLLSPFFILRQKNGLFLNKNLFPFVSYSLIIAKWDKVGL